MSDPTQETSSPARGSSPRDADPRRDLNTVVLDDRDANSSPPTPPTIPDTSRRALVRSAMESIQLFKQSWKSIMFLKSGIGLGQVSLQTWALPLGFSADHTGGRTGRSPLSRIGAPITIVPKRQTDGQYRRVPPSWPVSSLDHRPDHPTYRLLVSQLLGRRTCPTGLATRAAGERSRSRSVPDVRLSHLVCCRTVS